MHAERPDYTEYHIYIYCHSGQILGPDPHKRPDFASLLDRPDLHTVRQDTEIVDDNLTLGVGRRGGDPESQPGSGTGPGGGAAPGPVGIGLQERVQLTDIRRNVRKHQDD
jgi:hypothetical protein